MAPMPRSRPMPLCLNPPKGASTCTLEWELMLSTPLSTRRATRSARFRSFVQSDPLKRPDADHGAEDLFFPNPVAGFHGQHDGRFEEEAFGKRPPAAGRYHPAP